MAAEAHARLGSASATLAFDSTDTPGEYTVRATVVDRVAHRRLALSTPLGVAR